MINHKKTGKGNNWKKDNKIKGENKSKGPEILKKRINKMKISKRKK